MMCYEMDIGQCWVR